jgi:dCMP deaminase
MNWDNRWLKLSRFFALEFSKDPSTKCGAIIIRPDGKHMSSFGYNGFPKLIEDRPEYLDNREEKYQRIIHAELNAILNAGCNLWGCAMYTWPFPPCSECAKHVIQVGIRRVIFPKTFPPELYERWNIDMTFELFNESHMSINPIDIKE